MPLFLRNTLSRALERFEPHSPPKVTMYHCGPTVYSYAHVGNFRSFLLGDLLRRVLTSKGYEVVQVMNITDVGHMTEDELDQGEDKLAKAARTERRTPESVAKFYADAFFEDAEALGMLRAHHYPRASEHVPLMIEHIRRLMDLGYAYQSGDTILFDISRFERYGALSGRKIDELRAGFGGRVTEEELAAKRNPQDFRLWKVDPSHLMRWDSPWGPGYPGWHIECSTMAIHYLGETIDIHTGGEDNVFPHHESEIAQSEALTSKPFVRFWVHARHLLINGEKMSKSLGNTYRVSRFVEDLGVHPLAVRLAILSMHYGKQGNLTDESVRAAQDTIDRVRNFLRRMRGRAGVGGLEQTRSRISEFTKAWDDALDDDLNVSAALAALHELITDVNRIEPGAEAAQEAIDAVAQANGSLGILPDEGEVALALEREEIERLIAQRAAFRKERRFAEADQVRDSLKQRGILLEDGPEGTTWRVED